MIRGHATYRRTHGGWYGNGHVSLFIGIASDLRGDIADAGEI